MYLEAANRAGWTAVLTAIRSIPARISKQEIVEIESRGLRRERYTASRLYPAAYPIASYILTAEL